MDELKAETLFHLKMVDLLRKYQFRKILGETQIIHRSQVMVLKYISEHEGCSQVVLSQQFHVSPAAITKTINRLLKDKLIIKKHDHRNLRINLIFLSEKGKLALQNSADKITEIDELTFKKFKHEEITELKRLIDKMIINLSDNDNLNKNAMCELLKKILEGDADAKKN